MNDPKRQSWTPDAVLDVARSYQSAAVLAAAAELDVFSSLAAGPATARDLASQLGCDLRGIVILLDALTALCLLEKSGETYGLGPGIDSLLTSKGERTLLAMAQHQANCLRNWSQLAAVVKTGHPIPRLPSVRGTEGDQESFIAAMDNISAPIADDVISALKPLEFRQLLDIGGASGTWTMAFLRSCPTSRTVLFDLPHVLPMARSRLSTAGFLKRVSLVAGSFYEDALPAGSDFAWLSAIVHQNSRDQNRALFAKIFRALVPGGRLAIRDMVMEPNRTQPKAGALFAVNMLVATDGGGTFTLDELSDDLRSAGFEAPALVRRDQGMNSIVMASRPQG
jgi:predicted O-methyltransferase YrrM